jgi:hypothetical protein
MSDAKANLTNAKVTSSVHVQPNAAAAMIYLTKTDPGRSMARYYVTQRQRARAR